MKVYPGSFGALHPVDSEIPRLQTRHRAAMKYFDYINQSNLDACIQVLEPEDVRHEFDMAFKRFSKSMDMVMPSPKAQPYMEDLKFLGKVRQAAKSRYRDEGMDISDCGEKVKQLIAEHLHASSVEIIHEPIDILSSKFEQRLGETKGNEAKASEIEHAIRHEIKIKMEENPVFYTSLREKLEQFIQARKEKQLSIADLVEELRGIVDDMRNNAMRSEEQGFTREQYPFFQLLEQKLQDEEDVDILKDLTHIITELVQEEAVLEWTDKEDVQRQMRQKIKRQLRTSKCPKDQIEAMTHQIMELARVHYKR
jgi:type I restriction enzyme R subunit